MVDKILYIMGSILIGVILIINIDTMIERNITIIEGILVGLGLMLVGIGGILIDILNKLKKD